MRRARAVSRCLPAPWAVLLLLLLLHAAAGTPPAPRPKPLCEVLDGTSAARACGYVEHSDACCLEPLATSPVSSAQRHLAAGPEWTAHTNITFSGLVYDALYLVSHDYSCGPDHECWELYPGPMEPADAGAPSPPSWVQVTVSFLSGTRPYNVTRTTATVSRGAAAGAGGSGSNGTESADCKLLRASNPVLDVIAHNATLRVLPPLRPDGALSPAPRTFPAVNVTLHSDQCNFSCQDFRVPPQCRRGKYRKTDFYMKKPFEEVLFIPDVTRLHLALAEVDPALLNATRAANPQGPQGALMFHCARVFLGGCVVATPTVAVHLGPASAPAEVSVLASESEWNGAVAAVCFVLLPVCFVTLTVLVASTFLRHAGGYRCTLQSVGSAPRPEPGQDPGPKARPTASPETNGAPCRLLLLYSKPTPTGPDTNASKAFVGAIRALRRLLGASGASGRVQVMDMHEDPLLLEECAVQRASYFLGDEDLSMVLIISPDIADVLRCGRLLDQDPFQIFLSSIILRLCHAPERMASRLFAVSLDTRHHSNFLHGFPFNAHYVLPYHLNDLLEAIPGLSADVSFPRRCQAEEQALRRYIKQYTQQKREAAVVEV